MSVMTALSSEPFRAELACAAKAGNVNLVMVLLTDVHIDVDERDYDGCTALALAAKNGHADVASQLLAHGANPNLQDLDLATPLWYAAKHGHAGVVRLLLRSGQLSDVNPRPINSYSYNHPSNMYSLPSDTPLIVALKKGHRETAELLAHEEGIDRYVPIEQDISMSPIFRALGLAVRNGYDDVALALLKKCDLGQGSDDLSSSRSPDSDIGFASELLVCAAGAACSEVVAELLAKHHADVNAVHSYYEKEIGSVKQSSLMAAARRGNTSIVRLLLDTEGIQPRLRTDSGTTALILATNGGYVDIVKMLDADIRVESDHKDTNLHTAPSHAVERAHEGAVAALSATRAVNQDNQGIMDSLPPLMSAEDPEDRHSPARRQPHNGVVRQEQQLSSHGNSNKLSSDSYLDKSPNVPPELLQNELSYEPGRLHQLPLGVQEQYVSELAAVSVAKLCAICTEINLDVAFSSCHTDYGGSVIADLGMVDETWETRSCPLCCLFATVRPRTHVDKGHKLVSFSTTQSWLCHEETVLLWMFQDSWVDTMVLAVVADSVLDGRFSKSSYSHDLAISRIVNSALSSGIIGRLGSNCPDEKHAVTIQPLATRSDLSVARGWIRCCRENHSERCNPRTLAAIPHFRFIECITRHIIVEHEAGVTPPYVALSYVWGQSQSRGKQQQQPESLDEEGSGIVEPVIEDAICVAVELGYGYLWVDRYCIVQTGNEAVKQEQLRHMHTVYANAEVTLVAAAGTDAFAGLPGALERPRPAAHTALVQGHALMCIPPDPSHHIRSASTWATRGWTYQEGLLARRRLYFSKYEMSYECCDMLCREALLLPPAVEQRMAKSRMSELPTPRLMKPLWLYKPHRLAVIGPKDNGTGLFDLLETYSVRRLSSSSDILNAMLGIFQLLAERRKKPIYHVCGIPILYSKHNHSDNSTLAAARLALNGFANGLLWCLKHPASRRQGFPSWSWTGWQGVVTSMSEIMVLIRNTYGFLIDISIVAHGQDNNIVPWNNYYEKLRTADNSSKDIWSGQNHALEITARAVTVWLHKSRTYARTRILQGRVCAGDGIWQGEFWLTNKGNEGNSNYNDGDSGSLHWELVQKPWSGIVLGNSDPIDKNGNHYTYILVVQEQEQQQQQQEEELAADKHTCWERLGLLQLEGLGLKDSMLEQKTWRIV